MPDSCRHSGAGYIVLSNIVTCMLCIYVSMCVCACVYLYYKIVINVQSILYIWSYVTPLPACRFVISALTSESFRFLHGRCHSKQRKALTPRSCPPDTWSTALAAQLQDQIMGEMTGSNVANPCHSKSNLRNLGRRRMYTIRTHVIFDC